MRPFEYCRPTLTKAVPAGADWIHEIKHDGYRARIIRDGDVVKLRSKSGVDWTRRYPLVVATALKLRARQFVVDGEIVVLDVRGVSQFDWLHSNRHNAEAQLYAFDLIEHAGDDLRDLSLAERKEELDKLLKRSPLGIFRAAWERGAIGPDLFKAACRLRLEGIISKHRERRYRPRTCEWYKIKNRQHPAYARVMDQF
jgi:ATP-dependent DNA ligase